MPPQPNIKIRKRRPFVPGLRKDVFFITLNTNKTLQPGDNEQTVKENFNKAIEFVFKNQFHRFIKLLPKRSGKYKDVPIGTIYDYPLKLTVGIEIGTQQKRIHAHIILELPSTGYPWLFLNRNTEDPEGGVEYDVIPTANLVDLIAGRSEISHYNWGNQWYSHMRRVIDSVAMGRNYVKKDLKEDFLSGEKTAASLRKEVVQDYQHSAKD